LFKAVHVKTPASQHRRLLLTSRKLLQRKIYDIENDLRGSLRNFGLKVGVVGSAKFEDRIRGLVEGHPLVAAIVGPLLEARSSLRTQFTKLHRMLLDLVRADPVYRRFDVGSGRRADCRSNIPHLRRYPARFSRSKCVGAHYGLTPRLYQSGEVSRTGSISRCGDVMVRSSLYEAALVVLTGPGRWNPLKAWGIAVARRCGIQKAMVAVARVAKPMQIFLPASRLASCCGDGCAPRAQARCQDASDAGQVRRRLDGQPIYRRYRIRCTIIFSSTILPRSMITSLSSSTVQSSIGTS
jgi:transposase